MQGLAHTPKSMGTQLPALVPGSSAPCVYCPSSPSTMPDPFLACTAIPRPAVASPASSTPSCQTQSKCSLPDPLPPCLHTWDQTLHRPNEGESSKSMWLCSSLPQAFSPTLLSTYYAQQGDRGPERSWDLNKVTLPVDGAPPPISSPSALLSQGSGKLGRSRRGWWPCQAPQQSGAFEELRGQTGLERLTP